MTNIWKTEDIIDERTYRICQIVKDIGISRATINRWIDERRLPLICGLKGSIMISGFYLRQAIQREKGGAREINSDKPEI
jgi:predicted DNA-binding transcriptional regulator AlpA